MNVKQPDFGKRVREVRRARGLSQADLASGGVSASYVSLVESGLRSPRPKTAEAIAERLGVTLEELTGSPAQAQEPPTRLGLVGSLVAARSSRLSGDLQRAREDLEAAIRQAPEGQPVGAVAHEVLWEIRWELAATLDQAGDRAAHLEILDALLADPLTESAPLLRIRVLLESARALRHSGLLTESIRRAEECVQTATDLDPGSAERSEALVALASAYVESGDRQHADGLHDGLRKEARRLSAAPLRATSVWAAAGVRQLAGRPEEAAELLAEADALLGTADDQRLRTRLIRAQVMAALAADDPDTAGTLLGQLAGVTALLGSPGDRSVQAALEALRAMRLGRTEQALEHAASIDEAAPGLSAVEQAWCLLIRARARRAAGRPEEADVDYRTVADRYERAGAYKLALQTWRELSEPAGAAVPDSDPHGIVMP